jgi:hypothetical protein
MRTWPSFAINVYKELIRRLMFSVPQSHCPDDRDSISGTSFYNETTLRHVPQHSRLRVPFDIVYVCLNSSRKPLISAISSHVYPGHGAAEPKPEQQTANSPRMAVRARNLTISSMDVDMTLVVHKAFLNRNGNGWK